MCLCLAYNLVDDICKHGNMQTKYVPHIAFEQFQMQVVGSNISEFPANISQCSASHFRFFYTFRLCVETLALTQPRRLSPTDTLDLVRVASPSGWTTCSVMGQSTTSPLVSTPSFKTTPGTANTMKMQECGAMVSQSIMQFLLLEVFQ